MATYTIDSPPASKHILEESRVQAPESDWRLLYRIGGIVALIEVVATPIAILVYLLWPPPSFQPTTNAILDWFSLYQRNAVRGLFDLDLLMMLMIVLGTLLTLALYVALRQASQTFAAIALALGLMGAAIYVPTNPAFSMLGLSNQYAAATSDAQRASIVAAGQAMMVGYQSSAFNVSYIMMGISTLIIALVMLRSPLFSKGIAYVGIFTGVAMLIPSDAGTVGLIFAFASLVPMVIWYILVARRFFQLGKGGSIAQVKQTT
jgi:hypothetical protein